MKQSTAKLTICWAIRETLDEPGPLMPLDALRVRMHLGSCSSCYERSVERCRKMLIAARTEGSHAS
jgi:hypothetical protein